MKTTFKLSALALVMALTACSSGGGSSPSVLVDKATDAVKDTATKVEETAKDTAAKVEETVKDTADIAKETVKDVVSGDNIKEEAPAVVVHNYGGNYWYHAGNNSEKKGVFKDTGNKLVVEGKEIYLHSNHHKETPMQYNRFGWAINTDIKDNNTIVYSLGQLTEVDKVPTTGTAIYKGSAIYAGSSGFIDAQSELSVNFGDKTVNGRVYSTAHNIDEKFPVATISGNSFAGSSNASEVRGNFFGTNAEEIGGVYNSKNSVAAFGASRK